MPGPSPTPTKILEARGSWRAKTRPKEPRPKSERPTCPPHLAGEARKEWNRAVKQLHQLGVIAKCDRSVLTVYCSAWAELVELEKLIARSQPVIADVKGNLRRNPLYMLRDKAAERLLKYSDRLGLSPAARTRLETDKQNEQTQNSKSRFFERATSPSRN